MTEVPPCIISVAITGSVPRKKGNPALPVTVSDQIESTHAAYEAGAALVHGHVRVEGRHRHRPMAPHVNLWIVARGTNLGLATWVYFGDEQAANAEDPVLNIIEQPERRKTLIARREPRDGKPVYVFDIRLLGKGETVFFDI